MTAVKNQILKVKTEKISVAGEAQQMQTGVLMYETAIVNSSVFVLRIFYNNPRDKSISKM